MPKGPKVVLIGASAQDEALLRQHAEAFGEVIGVEPQTAQGLDAVRRHDAWRILVAADHPTPVSTKAHSSVPPQFCYAGTGIEVASGLPFSEAAAEAAGLFIDPGHAMIRRFMHR